MGNAGSQEESLSSAAVGVGERQPRRFRARARVGAGGHARIESWKARAPPPAKHRETIQAVRRLALAKMLHRRLGVVSVWLDYEIVLDVLQRIPLTRGMPW
eukprot:SAG11_NODE_22800_length_400_cov_0.485050_1_plen_100_part_01